MTENLRIGGIMNIGVDIDNVISNFNEVLLKEFKYTEVYNTTSFGAAIEGMKNIAFDDIQIYLPSSGVPFILGELKPFKFEIKDWAQEELHAINNIIAVLAKGVFSPALVSAIIKSSLMYQYMQTDILRVMQQKFNQELAESFIEKTKTSIKTIIDILQKNRLI